MSLANSDMRNLAEGFPTGALAEFSIAGPWSALRRDGGRLLRSSLVRPLIDFSYNESSAQLDNGTYYDGLWRAEYEPANTATFFSSYQSMVVAEAIMVLQTTAPSGPVAFIDPERSSTRMMS